jgi:hypothetical protein
MPYMNASFLRTAKHALTIAGTHLSDARIRRMQTILDCLAVGRWMASRGFRFRNRVQNRQQVWDVVLRQVADRRVLYLEFGVAGGSSMRYWSQHLKHPGAMLHGFDSFEGLPADGGPWKEGQFDTAGQVPVIDDPRVRFFKGWFDQSLPVYAMPDHDVLVINMDSDLYTSTCFVLNHLRPHVTPGTFIYFDEMCYPEHELRAFGEFIDEARMTFVPVCADQTMTFVCFQCVG